METCHTVTETGQTRLSIQLLELCWQPPCSLPCLEHTHAMHSMLMFTGEILEITG